MSETMTRDQAIAAAARCAAVAWGTAGGPEAFAWHDGLGYRPSILAQYVSANRRASAMDLYRFCVSGQPAAARWHALPPAQRAALEVFRATLIVLLFEIETETARAAAREAVASRMQAPPVPKPAATPPPKVADMDEAVAMLERVWTSDNGRPKPRRKRGKTG